MQSPWVVPGNAGNAVATLGIGRGREVVGQARFSARGPNFDANASERPSGLVVADDALDRAGGLENMREPRLNGLGAPCLAISAQLRFRADHHCSWI